MEEDEEEEEEEEVKKKEEVQDWQWLKSAVPCASTVIAASTASPHRAVTESTAVPPYTRYTYYNVKLIYNSI